MVRAREVEAVKAQAAGVRVVPMRRPTVPELTAAVVERVLVMAAGTTSVVGCLLLAHCYSNLLCNPLLRMPRSSSNTGLLRSPGLHRK